MKVEQYNSDSTDEISRLILSCLKTVNSNDYKESEIDFLCCKFSPQKVHKKFSENESFVIRKNDMIAGVVVLNDDREIECLFIHPKYQKQGFGEGLLRVVEEAAIARGDKRVWLRSSVTAYGFYKKFGYKYIKKDYNKQSGQTITMDKTLCN